MPVSRSTSRDEIPAVVRLAGGAGGGRDDFVDLVRFGQPLEFGQRLQRRRHGGRREAAAVQAAGAEPDHVLFAIDDLEGEVRAGPSPRSCGSSSCRCRWRLGACRGVRGGREAVSGRSWAAPVCHTALYTGRRSSPVQCRPRRRNGRHPTTFRAKLPVTTMLLLRRARELERHLPLAIAGRRYRRAPGAGGLPAPARSGAGPGRPRPRARKKAERKIRQGDPGARHGPGNGRDHADPG